MSRSILFVCGDEHARDVYGTALRRGGILPVFVDSVARALAFYQQVRVPLTVFHFEPDSPESWDDCMRLLTADTPVVVLTAHVRAGKSGAPVRPPDGLPSSLSRALPESSRTSSGGCLPANGALSGHRRPH